MVLNVEGDGPAGGVGEGARKSACGGEEGDSGRGGLQGGGEGGGSDGGSGCWMTPDLFHRQRPNSTY